MSFALYLDENVPVLLADLLRQLGYDVLTTQEAGRRGASDDEQIAFAAANQRAIFTHDRRDYGRLAQHWAESGRDHHGIVTSADEAPETLRGWLVSLQELFPKGIHGLYITLPMAA